METAIELQRLGKLYDVADTELIKKKNKTYGLLCELNRTDYFDMDYVKSIVCKLVAKFGEESYIVPPFRCDYGEHIFIGKHTYINYNCCFLDSAKITIGDYVYIGPNCNIYTPNHPIHHELRKEKILEYAKEVKVGSHSWIGSDVVIMPGVTIGENCVIGAGSVVTKDIPDNSLAMGNPCKVVREITAKDQEKLNDLILADETKDNLYKLEHGYLYQATDEAIFQIIKDTTHYINILNKLSNSEIQRRRDFLRTFVAKFEEGAIINSPFYMEFANHLEMGRDSFINYDCTILNTAMVKIGDNVLIGPKVGIYTVSHPLVAKYREENLAYAKPVTIKDNVWIGGSAIILPGVTIGENAIIGAGSVVTKDVPENTIVVGNPARVLREITEKDREKYYQEITQEQDNHSEYEKMLAGKWYNAMDYEMMKLRQENNKHTEAYSRITDNTWAYKDRMAKAIINSFGENASIIPPFTCDYGTNVNIGDDSVINHSGVFLDTNEINIGKNVLVGPNAGLYCALHPYDEKARREGMEKAKAINIGDGTWLGGKVVVLPGVTIGKHSVIGAGSVVTKDIPDDVVAIGNPCRVIRKITEDDKINPIRKK